MTTSPVCVDASFLLRLVLDDPLTERAREVWSGWRRSGAPTVAPALLFFEATNALYRYARHELLTWAEAEEALTILTDLDVEIRGDQDLYGKALRLAAQLGLPAAYDAHYLALADDLGAELWTADGRLARAVAAQLPWVKLLAPEAGAV